MFGGPDEVAMGYFFKLFDSLFRPFDGSFNLCSAILSLIGRATTDISELAIAQLVKSLAVPTLVHSCVRFPEQTISTHDSIPPE